jgi:hypothetical protein
MTPDSDPDCVRKLSLVTWAENISAALDRAVTSGWPDLKDRLDQELKALTRWEIVRGPPASFWKDRIAPVIDAWERQRLEPIRNAAEAELRGLEGGESLGLCRQFVETDAGAAAGNLLDRLAPLAIPAAVGVGGGTLAAGNTTTTTLLVFTTVVVAWPVLIAGLMAAVGLATIGGYSLASLRGRLKRRVLARIECIVVGSGIDKARQHIPSLRDLLVRQIAEVRDQLRTSWEKAGGES